MNPQILGAIGVAIAFVAGILSARGIISKETQDYLASPEVLAVVGTIGTAAIGVYQAIANRPSKRAAETVKRDPEGTAAKLVQASPQAVVAAAATVPGVETIVAEPHMAAAIPNDKVVAREF